MPFLCNFNLPTFLRAVLFSELFRSYVLLVYEIYYLWDILLPYLLASVAHSGKGGRSATGTPKDNDANTPADVPAFPANGNVSPAPAGSMFPEALPQLTPNAHCLEQSQTYTLACFTKL